MATRTQTKGLLVLTVAALQAGCGFDALPPPSDQWGAAQAEVRRAAAAGAAYIPEAELHTQLAQQELANSRQLLGRDNMRATTLSALARAEAELALSLATQAAAEGDARRAEEHARDAAGR